MSQWAEERSRKLREFFGLKAGAELLAGHAAEFELRAEAAEGLTPFQHRVAHNPLGRRGPARRAYFSRLYPTAPRDFAEPREHKASYLRRA